MKKYLSTVCFILLALPVTWAQSASGIAWPEKYLPANSRFYVYNEININASPEKVWFLLRDALKWSQWYKGAKDLSFLSGDSLLTDSAVFQWRTMGLKFRSVIREYQPALLLAWESNRKSIQGYHVWVIIPTDMGCKVITAESQLGWLAVMERLFQPRKLHRLHDHWLAMLKLKAETR